MLLNSNTTLVKVKLQKIGRADLQKLNSNTTLVKVKFKRDLVNANSVELFKYNTC